MNGNRNSGSGPNSIWDGSNSSDPSLLDTEINITHLKPHIVQWNSKGSRALNSQSPVVKTPILVCLSLCGCFPDYTGNRRIRYVMRVLLLGLSLGLLALNGWIFWYTASAVSVYRDYFTMLHGFTVCGIISGLKPLINLLNIIIFLLNHRSHSKMLSELNGMDKEMRKQGILPPSLTRWNAIAVGSAITISTILFCFRVFEMVHTGELPHWDMFLIPLVTFWNIVPLFYFIIVQSLVSHWAKRLNEKTFVDTRSKGKLSDESYENFLRLASVQSAVSDMLGPWILVSLSWGVFTLCLTIYFLTQTPPHFHFSLQSVAVLPSVKDREEAIVTLQFMFAWSSAQILITLLHIGGIGRAGISVNEETRKIVGTVLDVAPQSDTRVSRFMYKVSTQFFWGVTVWRAFPVERGLFFTMVSLIATYAVLLLRFNIQQNPGNCLNSSGIIDHRNHSETFSLENITSISGEL